MSGGSGGRRARATFEVGRVAQPFGFALTDPYVRIFRIVCGRPHKLHRAQAVYVVECHNGPNEHRILKDRSFDDNENDILARAKSDELRDNLRAANVVLVSTAGHGTQTTSFPSGTRELFRFMHQAAEPTLRIEANVSDDDYRELTLHSEEWRLPLILLADPAVSEVVIKLIYNFLSQRLRQLLPGRTAKVLSELVIEDKTRINSTQVRRACRHL